jgi:hypothetical protein
MRKVEKKEITWDGMEALIIFIVCLGQDFYRINAEIAYTDIHII